jgi:hypothetical protein
MSDFPGRLDRDFHHSQDYQALPEEQKARILRVLELMMDMAGAYRDEDDEQPDAQVPCGELV